MPSTAISVENLSKAYRIGLAEQRHETLVGTLSHAVRFPLRNFRRLSRLNTFKHCDEAEDIFWALRDVSFEVAEGEVVGIIGRNGAGKSTLLKILSRITEPTSGRATIHGRVSSLLEVGTGFHQELTGRENVYMNGTIHGMTKREIDRKFDEIVEFSGVEQFLDTPIKHYSSGMKVRLAFSVAAHLEPEILIIDEVLAVGDAQFQKKCLGKMQDVARAGRTVLFVSHNLAAAETLCTYAFELSEGRVIQGGDVTNVINDYRRKMLRSLLSTVKHSFEESGVIRSVEVLGADGSPADIMKLASEFMVKITINLDEHSAPVKVGIGIDSLDGQRYLTCLYDDAKGNLRLSGATSEVVCCVRTNPLPPGDYTVKVAIAKGKVEIASASDLCPFSIAELDSYNNKFHRGLCYADPDWTCSRGLSRESALGGIKER